MFFMFFLVVFIFRRGLSTFIFIFDGGGRAMSFVDGRLTVAAAAEVDVRTKWGELLDSFLIESPPEETQKEEKKQKTKSPGRDETPISLIIVAHVTYRSSLLSRSFHKWTRRVVFVSEKRRWQLSFAVDWHKKHRLFLFLNAWRWRYERNIKYKTNLMAAEEHFKFVIFRRCLNLWRIWIKRQEKNKTDIFIMSGDIIKTVRLSFFKKWRCVILRLTAVKKLQNLSIKWRRILYFSLWRHVVFFIIKKRQLFTTVLFLHSPPAWAEKTAVNLCANRNNNNNNCGGGAIVGKNRADDIIISHSFLSKNEDFGLFILRFYWICWLRETARLRGARLCKYRNILTQMENNRNGFILTYFYRKWLMCAVSGIQNRRGNFVMCKKYFYKWIGFLTTQIICEKLLIKKFCRLKHYVLQRWREITVESQIRHYHTAQADVFYNSRLKSRLSCAVFKKWITKLRLRCVRRELFEEKNKRRVELLREMAVSRLLNDVHFSLTSRRKTTNGGGGGGGISPRRLTSRTLAIPPAGRVGNNKNDKNGGGPASADDGNSGEHQRRNNNLNINNNNDGGGGGVNTSFPLRVALAGSDLLLGTSATPSTSAPAPPVLSSSVFDCPVDISEGKKLLAIYREMLTATPAEHDEICVLQNKLEICGGQKQSSAESPWGIYETEGEMRKRLFLLQQRKLNRAEMRAKVMRLANKLEEVLSVVGFSAGD